MKHVSKFMGEYEISESVSMNNGRVEYVDDITLIWRTDLDGPHILVGWHYGDYDKQIAEDYIKEYWANQHIQPKLKMMCLPIAYVHLIADCLDVIKKHELYKLMTTYDGTDQMIDILQSHVDEVIGYVEDVDAWADCDDILIAKEK